MLPRQARRVKLASGALESGAYFSPGFSRARKGAGNGRDHAGSTRATLDNLKEF